MPLSFYDWTLILGLGIMNFVLIEITKWFLKLKIQRDDLVFYFNFCG